MPTGYAEVGYRFPMIDEDDPRVREEFIEDLSERAAADRLILVGVVHDHPASRHRVQAVVESVDPSVVALELPPLAIPRYEQYAADERTPPVRGGEMSAAIQAAAPTASVVGIDGPSVPFLHELLRTCVRERPPPATAWRVARSLWSVSRDAVRYRVAAAVARRSTVDATVEQDCRPADEPHEQADDEWAQYRQSVAVSSALGAPTAVRLRDSVREAHMAARLAEFEKGSAVVAVVGLGHLEPLVDRLTG